MTTRVDPRPYAGPTDLVTAADVVEWLRERAERALLGNCHPPTHVLHYALVDLTARLDRERRQACERGAEDCEAQALKYTGRGENERYMREDFARRAIAFRAAARAK